MSAKDAVALINHPNFQWYDLPIGTLRHRIVRQELSRYWIRNQRALIEKYSVKS
jgi:hypothetical protein